MYRWCTEPLIGIEDFRCSKAADGLFNDLNTKIGIQGMDTRQDKTLRLCQSMTATRYMNTRFIGIQVMSAGYTWLELSISRILNK